MSSKQDQICELFKIELPIVQAGMVWCSGAKLAAAAANAGCLGLIGAASMTLDVLREQIIKARSLTSKPVGVNIPLLYKHVGEQVQIALDEGVRIFFTSAGSPKTFTRTLKEKGCVVVHVTSSPALALKCQNAEVDAVVAEGFEAGGHNGREEITTMVLIPEVVDAVKIPVIAAGGIGDGRAIAAAFALGAGGVQIGSRFAATKESSAHDNFKRAIVEADPGATMLMMKKLVPVRLLRNKFFTEVQQLEERGASTEEIAGLLGKGRARKGMFDGDLEEGELEIGQISGLIRDIPSVADLVKRLQTEYKAAVALCPKSLK